MQRMNSMHDLMRNMLIGLYTAEQQALEALPQLAEHVETPELRSLLQQALAGADADQLAHTLDNLRGLLVNHQKH